MKKTSSGSPLGVKAVGGDSETELGSLFAMGMRGQEIVLTVRCKVSIIVAMSSKVGMAARGI